MFFRWSRVSLVLEYKTHNQPASVRFFKVGTHVQSSKQSSWVQLGWVGGLDTPWLGHAIIAIEH